MPGLAEQSSNPWFSAYWIARSSRAMTAQRDVDVIGKYSQYNISAAPPYNSLAVTEEGSPPPGALSPNLDLGEPLTVVVLQRKEEARHSTIAHKSNRRNIIQARGLAAWIPRRNR